MKLDELALLEVVEIVRNGLLNMSDISEDLRELDLVEGVDGKLSLSEDYQNNRR